MSKIGKTIDTESRLMVVGIGVEWDEGIGRCQLQGMGFKLFKDIRELSK